MGSGLLVGVKNDMDNVEALCGAVKGKYRVLYWLGG